MLRVSPECPAQSLPHCSTPESPWSPTLECSWLNPESPCSAQPQSFPVSLECPSPECPRSAQLRSLPGVPNLRVSLKCSECPRSAQPKVSHTAQPQSLPGVPNHRVSQCPQSLPGVPNPKMSPECPAPEYFYQERVGTFEVK